MDKRTERSGRLYEEALRYMPGGVNSPVRAYRAVGGDPLFIAQGKGAVIIDVDGNEYVDCVLSWGPLILGHADPDVIAAVKEAAELGTSFGAPTERETILAKLVVEMVPSVEMLRFVNSGTEAVMGAVRLARGVTGREKVIKFDGCYHGHADYLLVQAGSGGSTLGVPDSRGVPAGFTRHTIRVPFNDGEAVRSVFRERGAEIAAVLVEPVPGNMGLVLPAPGFLELLRDECDKSGSLLIFDEVMSGFRISLGGAQEKFGVMPDLTCLGKVIGGGLPVGAFGGRRDIMGHLAPLGDVYQAGTLSGNPVAISAGIATLGKLKETDAFPRAEEAASAIVSGLWENIRRSGARAAAVSCGTIFSLFFLSDLPRNYEEVKRTEAGVFARYFRDMLGGGVYLPPSVFESCFTSSRHSPAEIDTVIRAGRAALGRLV